MTFSSAWLELRVAADERSRARDLIVRAARDLARMTAPRRVLDLGAGTGATLRALAPALPPAEWTLLDADAALLAEARRRARPEPTVRVADLATDPLWDRGSPPHLVTASALFDLASAEFVARLAERLGEDRVPLLAMLTYDGRLAIHPPHPRDGAMVEAFNTHQRGAKSFGPALGPDGARALTEAMERVGATVTVRDTPWRLSRPMDGALMDAMLDGWAHAAREAGANDTEEWREAHRGARTLLVGHRDHHATF